MIIKLDDDYQVTSDAYNYILQEKRIAKTGKKKGEEIWANVGYYSKLESLLKGYKDKSIKKSDLTTINEVLELVKKIDLHISKILQGI